MRTTKLFLLTILLCLTASLSLQAQSDAFYIYRNDGQFNAFFDADVDSITYSHYDADSLYHTDWQMQVIHTADSVYRIPLEVIDSISFEAPAPIISKDVVRMEEGLLDYLVKVDGMDLTFSSLIPHFLQPSKGDILVCTDFENPLFEEGFVGKVYDTSFSSEGYVVYCDTVNDITEVFERLVAIEEVSYTGAEGETRGIWSSASIPIQANLNYDTDGSAGLDVSMSGSVNGTVKATVVYNITREHQHVSVNLNHDWSLGANIKLKAEGKFLKSSPAKQLTPAIRFPAALPLLKFQLFGATFVRGSASADLDVSLNGPVHSYVSGIVYENGAFSGVHRSLGNQTGDVSPEFASTLSLNGNAQGGFLLDCYLGTIQCMGYVKAAVDFYIGPKINGNFNMDLGAAVSRDYYNTVKDSKLGLSLLSIDAEAYGEAAYMGEPIARHTFMDISLASLLYNEWFLFPEFSDIAVEEDESEPSVTLSCSPSRNVLIPLTLGIGLYDKDNELLEVEFADEEYKRDNSGFEMNHTFTSLVRNKAYTACPMIKFAGGEFPATPSKDFRLDVVMETGNASSVTKNSAEVSGSADGLESAEMLCELGVCYNTAGNPTFNNSQFVTSGRKASGDFSITLNDLKPNTTYYYVTCLMIDGEYFYGDVRSFKTEKSDEPTPGEAIDLGLSVKWASHNVGASSPEGYGGYYAWGETEEKSSYYWGDYKYCNNSTGDFDYIGSNISGTQYDVAHVKWGGSWRMPTRDEIKELVNKCTWKWTSLNGVNGQLVTGPNGNSIFLPAAGDRRGTDLHNRGSYGYYWSATLGGSNGDYAYDLYFLSDGSYWVDWNDRDFGRSVRPVTE
ncbi:MAG: hypothetical protein IJP08_05875 [Bacteroidaceae bacterium]|nr:hypothetical protein [Bacteroidaceae bacterium]